MAAHPKDPRVVFSGRHRERGKKRFRFTYEDIADVAGVSAKTVRNAAARDATGHAELDPYDLASICAFIARRARRVRGSSA